MSTWSGGRELGCDAVCCCRRMLIFRCLKAQKVPSLDTLPNCFFLARLTGSGLKLAADTWTRRLSGCPEPLTNSMRGVFRALWPLLMRGVWMEKNLAASGKHFCELKKNKMLGEHLLESQHFGRKSNVGQDFVEDFSPYKAYKNKCLQTFGF